MCLNNLFHHTVLSPNDFSVFLKITVTITIRICTIGKVSKKLFFFICLNNQNTVGTKQKQDCTYVLACLYLQSDVSPRQTTSSAEANLHIVKPTLSLGDISDLNVTMTLGLGLICRKPRSKVIENENRGMNELKFYFQ